MAAALPVHDEREPARRLFVDEHLFDDRADDLFLQLDRARGLLPHVRKPVAEGDEGVAFVRRDGLAPIVERGHLRTSAREVREGLVPPSLEF